MTIVFALQNLFAYISSQGSESQVWWHARSTGGRFPCGIPFEQMLLSRFAAKKLKLTVVKWLDQNQRFNDWSTKIVLLQNPRSSPLDRTQISPDEDQARRAVIGIWSSSWPRWMKPTGLERVRGLITQLPLQAAAKLDENPYLYLLFFIYIILILLYQLYISCMKTAI